MSSSTIQQFLLDLKGEDIRIWLDGERLRVSTPKGAFPALLREELSTRRGEIVAFLRHAGQAGETPAPALVPVARGQDLPLSFDQDGMWFLHQLDPDNIAYNLQTRLLVQCAPEVAERAWNALLERHEVLRTTYAAGTEGPRQRIHPHVPVTIAVADLTDSSVGIREEFEEAARRQLQRPFDLAGGPVWKIHAYRLPGGALAIFLTIHHIATDGWSLAALNRELRELCEAYAHGREPVLAPLPIQYADYAAWQRTWLSGDVLERHLGYWRERLAGMPAALALPTDRSRPAIPGTSGTAYLVELPEAVCSGIRAVGQRCHATFFMTLLAVFKVLLARYSSESDIVVGMPIAGRGRPEVDHVQGLFLNSLVLRTDLSGDLSFTDLLGRVRETVLGAFAHQELPFEKLVQALRPKRVLNRNPLFQVMFNNLFDQFRSGSSEDLDLERGSDPWSGMDAHVQFDLTLNVHEGSRGVGLLFSYNTDLFRPATIERMAGHYVRLAEAVVADARRRVSELELLSGEERARLVREWNDTGQAFEEVALSRLFERQVARSPEAIALEFEGERLSYGELNARANRLARYLRGVGVGREVKVAVLLERGVQMVVGVLGVMKAGGAYVPLDPAYPGERVAFMLEDSGVQVLLVERGLRDGLAAGDVRVVSVEGEAEAIARQEAADLEEGPRAGDLAYMIYTSGSTGQPKGVQIEHGALSNFLQSMLREPGLDREDVLLAVTTLSFDIAGLELYLPLVAGARVVLAGREVAADGAGLAALLRSSGATLMQATPATWRLLLAAGWEGDGRLKILCGGEGLARDLAEALLKRGGELWNLYGPTETTIWSTVHRVRTGTGVVPIGRPIANTRLYILDERGQAVPVGVPGELYIGGAGLARGYWRRAQLDAERFVADALSGEAGARLYRTGDRARYLGQGEVEHLGRLDTQVKLRGFRIELGEIEAVLGRQAGVREAVVQIREERPGDQRLVAYVVSAGEARPEVEQLRTGAGKVLPAYMVPSAYVFLEALPLTPNGKIDRKALPAVSSSLHPGESYAPPQTDYERVLASIWCEVLNVDRVSVNDNFFDIGGHSLLAIESITRFRDRTGRSLDPRLFYQQTLGQLAASVDGAETQTRKAAASTATLEIEPFFFGAEGRTLYGLLRVTPGHRDAGVVMCQPHAHEYIRCHRAFRELGQRLAWAGYPVLSFDYFGTGDSGGEYEDGTIAGWITDTVLAIDTLKQKMKVERFCLIGLRLGATLAMMAAAQRRDPAGIALWDPIVSGADVAGELARIRNFQGMDPVRQRDVAYPDVLSYSLTPGMERELGHLDLCALPDLGTSALLVLETEGEGSGRRFADRARALAPRVDYQCIEETRLWLREPYEAIVPRNSMEALVSWTAGLLA